MKSAIFLANVLSTMMLTVLALPAHAVLRTPGSFLPSQCGLQKYTGNQVGIVDIQAICVGQLIGEGDAVQFRLTDGTEQVYTVQDSASMLVAFRSGFTKSIYHLVGKNGETASMKVVHNNDLRVQNVSGTLGGVGYFVPEFQQMFVAQ